eukprot:CAMPEP_0204876166 /NCGR_PEP_ID=MMETSP1348-20121228/47482_1 /ASSEMBLY_ACC=CAM_ASM_000700 /TAXON_ID=215587 /ORGANISM="Aplanochytrium stocchinoi, Strain GSBS06" /LENGTH=447 /DNA_ID=CAMNT_0052032887 /DNA_START=44 /DNA_END=1388 /DNA_ORIENTATION=+
MGGPEDAGRNREMRFQAALDYVLTEAVFQPKDERIFYGLYQQIMFGDCTEPEPANGTTDELKDYQSWLFFKGLDAIRGKELYVITLEKLAPKFNADNYGGPEFEKNTMKSIKTRLSKLDSMGLSKNPHTSVSQSIRDKRISSTMVSVTAVASQKGIKRNTARSKKKTSVANYQGSRIRTRPTTELPHVANVYIPQLPSVADPYSEAGRKEMLERMSGGLVLPSGGTKMDSMAFADLRERLITFYRRVAPERIKAGLGNILQFAEENGEEALNKELRDKYGQDLDFLSPKEKPDPYLENIVSELDIDFNKKKVSPNGKLKKEIKNYKKLLVKFLQKNESSADKIEKYLHFMNKYLDEKGIAAMNEKLKEKYGKDIDLATRQTGATPKSPKPSRSPKSPKLDLSKATKEFTNMSRKDAEMLQIYFEKYDPGTYNLGISKRFYITLRNTG